MVFEAEGSEGVLLEARTPKSQTSTRRPSTSHVFVQRQELRERRGKVNGNCPLERNPISNTNRNTNESYRARITNCPGALTNARWAGGIDEFLKDF